MFRIHTYTKKLKQWMVFTCYCLGFFIELNAQSFGFEWANTSTQLLKFPVVKKGMHQISALQLEAAGWNLNAINPSQIKLFVLGNEVPIYLQQANKPQIQQTDKLYFYANQSNALLDQLLYESPAEIPHLYNSLFQDTVWYFIGVDTALNKQALRLENALELNSIGLSNFDNFEQVYHLNPQEFYYRGKRLPANEAYYSSAYAGAESWASTPIEKSKSRIFSIAVHSFKPNSIVQFKAIAMGLSDYFVADNNAPNHHLKISLLTKNAGFVKLIDTTYKGAVPITLQTEFNSELTDTLIQFKIEVPDDLLLGADAQVLSLIEIKSQQAQLYESVEAQNLFDNAGVKGILPIFNPTSDSLLLFNLTDLKANWIQGNFAVQLNSNNCQFVCAAVNSTTSISQIQRTELKNFFSNDSIEYLIVSSKKIESAAQAYSTYRSSMYKTQLYFIEDLANTYAFGIEHPIAIQRLCAHVTSLQAKPPQFLLLLGKGYQADLLKQNPQLYASQLVPVIGDPVSDQLFTEKLNENSFYPAIATGRLAASSDQEVFNYLNKLIVEENNPDSIAWWRKQIVHVSGGEDYLTEQLPYTQQLNKLKAIAQNTETAYEVNSFNKNSQIPVSENQENQIIKFQNQGLNLFTFLGHGSLSVLDVSIGSIAQLQANNKATFYYLNGCSIGNPATQNPQGIGNTYANDYLFAKQKGAIGWLAHSNVTLNTPLFLQMEQVYHSFALNRKSIGEQIQSALMAYTSSSDAFSIEHARQLILQGDPAYHLYQPRVFDLQIEPNAIWMKTPSIHAQLKNIQIAFVLKNLGKSIADSVAIAVKRTLPNQTQIQLPVVKIKIPATIDTVFYTINGIQPEQAGLNELQIKIIAPDSLHEFSSQNNEANFSFYLPGTTIQFLSPLPFTTIKEDSVALFVQSLNQLNNQPLLFFEIDTSPNFDPNSFAYKQFSQSTKSYLYQQNIPLPFADTLVYWWRTKSSNDSVLTTSSFKHEPNQETSFTQANFNQLSQVSALQNLSLNPTEQKIEFASNVWELGIENRRWDHRMMGLTVPYLLNEGVGNCISQGVVALVFDPNVGAYPLEISSYPFNCAYVQNNRNNISNRYYAFNTNTIAGEQELVQFLSTIPASYEVAIFSRYASNVAAWQESTKQILTSLGVKKITAIQSPYTAWALIGSKASPSTIVEDTISNSELAGKVSLPPLPNEAQDNRFITVQKSIVGKWFEGSFTTQWIGPARKFKTFTSRLEALESSDIFSIQLFVKTNQNTDSLVLESTTLNPIDLTNRVSPQYQFVKFKFYFKDSTQRTAPQIKNWVLSYDPVAELLIDPSLGFQIQPNPIQQGDLVSIKLPIRNISNTTTDSSQIHWQVADSLNQIILDQYTSIPPVHYLDTIWVAYSFPSVLLAGSCSLTIALNPNKKFPEIDYSNNYFKYGFFVKTNRHVPNLEILVDGRKIISGDLISAKPIFEFRLTEFSIPTTFKDTLPFELKLRRPQQSQFETIQLQTSNVKYFAPSSENKQAILQYFPEFKSDGMYAVQVKAIDPLGNWTAQATELQFEVKQAATISHFYPYPNPFTTQMRFVFTLTGSELPEKIQIRIFTVDGRLVKEIDQNELGPIHIGNNISNWYWDGKDQYGDQLANGVYLYTVTTHLKGNALQTNAVVPNESQSYFKANTGKIYLMR